MAGEGKTQTTLNIKIGDEEQKGRYSNLLRIAHSREEFILDFINLVPPLALAESVLILGEPLSGALLAGAGLVVAGLYLINRPRRS